MISEDGLQVGDGLLPTIGRIDPPRILLEFEWGEQRARLEIRQEVTDIERDCVLRAWINAVDKLVVR